MQKLFDGSGNAVEAFTKDEVEKLVNENPKLKETSDALTKAQTDLTEAGKKIEEFTGSDKGQNMAALRKGKEDAEKEVERLKGSIMTEIGGLKKKFDDVELDKSLIEIAQGDPELMKKVKLEYERIVKSEDTEEEKRKKMGDAYKLAAGYNASPSVLGRVLGSSGAPVGGGQTNNAKPELVEFGKKFGLTEEDFKKYGRK